MCGIAGSLGTPDVVPRLLAALVHRGPDHLGRWTGPGVSLGAARLRIRGDARSDMPLVDATGCVRLVGNAEIFNHAALGPAAPGASDLSALPDLWREEGTDLLARLRGPFALAVWDARDASLTLARDEVGVRPLHWARLGREAMAFASEPGALLRQLPAATPDPAAWDHLLALHFWPRDRAPWTGLHTVVPGTWVRFRRTAGRLAIEEGRFAFGGANPPLAHAVEEAFALQAPRAAPAAVTLSGGLDSSAVVGGLEAAGHAVGLAAVGWFPEGPDALDERPHARARAAEAGLRLLEVPITAAAWWEAARTLVARLGAPLAGPGGPSQLVVAQALAREGVRIVYSGQGGDELFGGYERHRLLQQRAALGTTRPAPGYEPLARLLAARGAAGLLDRAHGLRGWLEPARRRGVDAVLAALPGEGPGGAEALLDWECDHLLPGLLQVEDATVAAFGMEGRVPLLDPVLARGARALPLAEKSPWEAPRARFREVLGARAGVAARRGDKMGFPLPLASWLQGPLRSLLHDHPGLGRLGALGLRPGVVGAMRQGALPPRAVAFLLQAAECLATRAAPADVGAAS